MECFSSAVCLYSMMSPSSSNNITGRDTGIILARGLTGSYGDHSMIILMYLETLYACNIPNSQNFYEYWDF
jgi:hypothetical protein